MMSWFINGFGLVFGICLAVFVFLWLMCFIKYFGEKKAEKENKDSNVIISDDVFVTKVNDCSIINVGKNTIVIDRNGGITINNKPFKPEEEKHDLVC